MTTSTADPQQTATGFADLGPIVDDSPIDIVSRPHPIPLPRSVIQARLEALIEAGVAGATNAVLLNDRNAIVYAEHVRPTVVARARIEARAISLASQVEDGQIGLPLTVYVSRRDEIHRQILQTIEDWLAEDEPRPDPDDYNEQNELIATPMSALRSSSVEIPQRSLAIMRQRPCQITVRRIIEGWCEAERELNRHVTDAYHLRGIDRDTWKHDHNRIVADRDRRLRRCAWTDHLAAPTAYGEARRKLIDTLAGMVPMLGDGHPANRAAVAELAWACLAAERGQAIATAGIIVLDSHRPLSTSEAYRLTLLVEEMREALPVSERAASDDDVAAIVRDIDAIDPDTHSGLWRLAATLGQMAPSGIILPEMARRCARIHLSHAQPDARLDVMSRRYEDTSEPSRLIVLVVERQDGSHTGVTSGQARAPKTVDDAGTGSGAMEGVRSLRLRLETEPDAGSIRASTEAWIDRSAAPAGSVGAEARRIAAELGKTVLAQPAAVQAVSAGLAELLCGRKERGGILLAGPSGCGKSWLAKEAARVAGDLPYYAVNAAAMSPVGIRGMTVDSIIVGLIAAAGNDWDVIEERGAILLLDEWDKAATEGSATGYGPVIIGSMLRLLDGEPHTVGDMDDAKITHPHDKNRKFARGSTLRTDKILILMTGAWSAQREDAAAARSVGFAVGDRADADPGRLGLDDLAGLPVELRGRVNRFAPIVPLGRTELAAVLDASLPSWMPDDHGAVTADARATIVDEAMRRGTGARGLRVAVVSLRDRLVFGEQPVGGRVDAGYVRAALRHSR